MVKRTYNTSVNFFNQNNILVEFLEGRGGLAVYTGPGNTYRVVIFPFFYRVAHKPLHPTKMIATLWELSRAPLRPVRLFDGYEN